LQQIVNWMMAKDPNQRYPTPERAAQAMQVFLAAGQETLAAPERDPKMHTYLTWLEKENSKRDRPSGAAIPVATAPTVPLAAAAAVKPPTQPTPTKPPTSTAVPIAQPVAPASPSQQNRPPNHHGERPVKKRGKKRGRSRPTLPPIPEPPVAAIAQPAIADVELVPLPSPAAVAVPASPRRIGLTRRDVLCFLAGAGSAGCAGIFGGAIALLVRKFAPSSKPQPPPAPPSDEGDKKD
jgi:hypothetical protein